MSIRRSRFTRASAFRFVLQVSGLDELVATLRGKGVAFRNVITEGPGGRQILCEDPSGNVVELFEPAAPR